eukprot:scaffold22393_cov151-Isochrysis_galbana.AAC.1
MAKGRESERADQYGVFRRVAASEGAGELRRCTDGYSTVQPIDCGFREYSTVQHGVQGQYSDGVTKGEGGEGHPPCELQGGALGASVGERVRDAGESTYKSTEECTMRTSPSPRRSLPPCSRSRMHHACMLAGLAACPAATLN